MEINKYVILMIIIIGIDINLAINIDMPSSIKHCDSYDFVNITGGIIPYTYQWTPTVGLTSPNSKLPGFQYYTGLPTNYTLNVTDDSGLWTTENILVESISLDVGVTSVKICGGWPTVLPLAILDGQFPYSVNWSPSTYLDNPNISNPLITVNTAESLLYTATVIDSDNCQGEIQLLVKSENPQIIYSVIPSDCQNGGSIIDISVNGILSACWSFVDEASTVLYSGPDASSIPDITGLTDGNYRFELSCNICPYVTDYINIAPSDDPIISIPASRQYCDFDNGDIIISGGTGSYSYKWTPTEYLIDSTQRFPMVKANAPLPLLLTLEVTDSNGCTEESSISISGSPTEMLAYIQSISCINATDAIITVRSVDDSSGLICRWINGDIGCVRNNLSTGSYIVSITDNCKFTTELIVDIVVPDFNDTDADGTIDCLDNCPNDSGKIEVGICGCGHPDTDEDNDGHPICIDQCDTDPRLVNESCKENIVIPKIIQGSNNDDPIIAVTIPQEGINIVFNVSTSNSDDPLDKIEVRALPLTEVDVDGNIIQSLDLAILKWRNALTINDGYEILASTTTTELDGAIVNLTYHNYFFHRNCFIYDNEEGGVTGYGIINKIISCPLNNSDDGNNDESYTQYRPGDSKLSFTVENWPFQDSEHMLRATYEYNSLKGIDSHHLKYKGDIANIIYTLNTGVKLSINFLTTSVIDDELGPVDIQRNDINQITVLFDNFDRLLTYDPSLHFLFTTTDESDTDDWTTWLGPVIAACGALIISILCVLLVRFNNRAHYIVYGPEGVRVDKLRLYVRNSKKLNVPTIDNENLSIADILNKELSKTNITNSTDIEV